MAISSNTRLGQYEFGEHSSGGVTLRECPLNLHLSPKAHTSLQKTFSPDAQPTYSIHFTNHRIQRKHILYRLDLEMEGDKRKDKTLYVRCQIINVECIWEYGYPEILNEIIKDTKSFRIFALLDVD
jgi:hypothetical protein